MIGDREDPAPDDPDERWGPLDAMVRLSPPKPDKPLVWVERYDRLVVCRYTHGEGDGVTREQNYPSEAAALHAFTTAIAKLLSAGYRRVDEASRV